MNKIGIGIENLATPLQLAFLDLLDVFEEEDLMRTDTIDKGCSQIARAIQSGDRRGAHKAFRDLWEFCAGIGYTQRYDLRMALARVASETLGPIEVSSIAGNLSLRSVIVSTLLDRGEEVLDDDGVDPKVCESVADEIVAHFPQVNILVEVNKGQVEAIYADRRGGFAIEVLDWDDIKSGATWNDLESPEEIEAKRNEYYPEDISF